MKRVLVIDDEPVIRELIQEMLQIGGFRPKNFDEEFLNVFYAGASTIPGTGLPMVIISSKLATDRVEEYSRR